MMPFLNPQIMRASTAGFTGYSTTYTTIGAQSVSVPAGATSALLECIGGGGGSRYDSDFDTIRGGGGAAYAKKQQNISGISTLTVTVGGVAVGQSGDATTITSGATTYCAAAAGGTTSSGQSGVGDTIVFGQNGSTAGDGGAAGGPNGAGTSPGGAGASAGTTANLYGGGAPKSSGDGAQAGAQGWARITWS